MLEKWRLINETLTNTYEGQLRDVAPISNDDKRNIVQLDETEALMLWSAYFSEKVKYALLFERTYGEPLMTEIFDESKIDAKTRVKILRSMHSDETLILLYWSKYTAVKTTWGMFIKYWDNFFYSAGDEAIIYVNQNEVYTYSDMFVRKINKLKIISEESAYDYLQIIGDEKEKKLRIINNLFNDVSNDLQDSLYIVILLLSEGLRSLENEELRKEYLDYYSCKVGANTTNVLLCKPYSEENKKDYYKFLEDSWSKPQEDKFFKFLMKIIKKN